jgi:hypothetical protein
VTPDRFRPQPGGSKHPTLDLFDGRDDLRGVPVLRGAEAELNSADARALGAASAKLRGSIGTLLTATSTRYHSAAEKQARSARVIAAVTEIRPDLLVWVLQTEADPLRESMIELFGRTGSPAAARALAHRALFEPDPGLRKFAVTFLKARGPEHARPVLLAALRYLWPSAADHAADTLAAIQDHGAAPALVQLLDAPDPAGPFPGDGGVPTVREVMRINHARNCQLCHAPSFETSDRVRAPVPSPNRPLPPSFWKPTPGSSAPPGSATSGAFVRADVIYLRPDFSMDLPVENPGP